MTLRVRISIVPFGDETQEREIHQINISNLGSVNEFRTEFCKYGVELNKYKTGEYDALVKHWRDDGAIYLVNTALEKLLINAKGDLK
jgi:hypothetical protein